MYHIFQEVNKKVTENSFNMSINNLGTELFNNPILEDNQEYLHDLMAFGNKFQLMETNNASSTMSPSTSGIENLSVRDQLEQLKQLGETIENEDRNTIKNEYFNFNSSYSDISRSIDIRFDSVNLFNFI